MENLNLKQCYRACNFNHYYCLPSYIDTLFWLSFIFKNLNSSTPLYGLHSLHCWLGYKDNGNNEVRVTGLICVQLMLSYESLFHCYQNPSIKPTYKSSFSMNHKKRLERYLHLVWQKNTHCCWRITVGSHILFLCIEKDKHINSQVIHMASIGIRFAIREWSIMRKSPLII